MFWINTIKFLHCVSQVNLRGERRSNKQHQRVRIQSTIRHPALEYHIDLLQTGSNHLYCTVLHFNRLHRYIFVSFDTTVWPANATYVRNAMNSAAAILALSSASVCHLQFPVNQTQTSAPAAMKHRRILEDQAVKLNLNLAYHVLVMWERRQSADRGQGQICSALFHNNYPRPEFANCEAVQTGAIGPVPLIAANDMLGYDETTRPGPSATVEQVLV